MSDSKVFELKKAQKNMIELGIMAAFFITAYSVFNINKTDTLKPGKEINLNNSSYLYQSNKPANNIASPAIINF